MISEQIGVGCVPFVGRESSATSHYPRGSRVTAALTGYCQVKLDGFIDVALHERVKVGRRLKLFQFWEAIAMRSKLFDILVLGLRTPTGTYSWWIDMDTETEMSSEILPLHSRFSASSHRNAAKGIAKLPPIHTILAFVVRNWKTVHTWQDQIYQYKILTSNYL